MRTLSVVHPQKAQREDVPCDLSNPQLRRWRGRKRGFLSISPMFKKKKRNRSLTGQQLCRPLFPLLHVPLAQDGHWELHVLKGRQVGQQVEGLKDEAWSWLFCFVCVAFLPSTNKITSRMLTNFLEPELREIGIGGPLINDVTEQLNLAT